MDVTAGRLVVVTGASGGLGASTLACGLAVAAHRCGLESVVVDGDLCARGLQVTAGVEHLPGLRWDDLAHAQGDICGDRLLAVLPVAQDGPPVLSGSGLQYGRVPSAPTARATLGALLAVRDLVVVDIPLDGLGLVRSWDPLTILLGGEDPTRLADLGTAVERLRAAGPLTPELVMRGPVRHHDLHQEVAAELGLRLLGTWGTDRRLQSDVRRGLPPGGSVQVRRLTDSVLASLADRPEALTPTVASVTVP